MVSGTGWHEQIMRGRGLEHICSNPGYNLGQGPTQPWNPGAQLVIFKPDETNHHANDKGRGIQVKQKTNKGQTRGAPINHRMGLSVASRVVRGT